MQLCCQSFLERLWSRNGQANAVERMQRKILSTFAFIAVPMTMLLLMNSATRMHDRPIAFFVTSYNILFTACMLVYMLRGGHLTQRVVVMYLGAVQIGLFLSDLSSRTLGGQSWPLFVLVIDLLLVLRVDEIYTTTAVVSCIVWLPLMALESSFRMGLFDLPLLPPVDGPNGRRAAFSEPISCETPPCAIPLVDSVRPLMIGLGVFLIDFIATRGFARQVLAEQAAMERTISTVEGVTGLLAKYDVEGVNAMLAAREADLPGPMFATLKTMEDNLRKYRAYLPAALFEVEEDIASTVDVDVAPPGLHNGEATIVFTDIRASTSIWECAPEGMRAGLRIHNAVIREVMRAFGGYEVKTIGDAFMIAFNTTQDGMGFALRVHERLREADWPASLLNEAPICAKWASLWGGLTVRIGVNTGPVTVEHTTLTGRMDYFGHTVNVASRLENTCKPGAVAILSDLWTTNCASCTGAVVSEPEAIHLRGVKDCLFVYCVWPASLQGRKRLPLRGDNILESTSTPTQSSRGSCSPLAVSLNSSIVATIGVIAIPTGEVMHRVVCIVNSGLQSLSVLLSQSGGVLIALVGNSVCAGWNLVRTSPAHMETALRFAQRLQRVSTAFRAGLATGVVQHGDIGSRTERFVAVLGSPVQRSWSLCERAVAEELPCLFAPPENSTLPPVLHDMVVAADPGVYTLAIVRDCVY